jgi:GTPase
VVDCMFWKPPRALHVYIKLYSVLGLGFWVLSGTIIRGTLKTPNSQLVTPISIKLQRPDGCD